MRARSDDTNAPRRRAQGSSRRQSISGTGGGVRFEGLLIKPGFSLQRRMLIDFISKNPLSRVSLLALAHVHFSALAPLFFSALLTRSAWIL